MDQIYQHFINSGLSPDQARANAEAAANALPLPFDIPNYTAPGQVDTFGDTAVEMMREPWAQAKADWSQVGPSGRGLLAAGSAGINSLMALGGGGACIRRQAEIIHFQTADLVADGGVLGAAGGALLADVSAQSREAAAQLVADAGDLLADHVDVGAQRDGAADACAGARVLAVCCAPVSLFIREFTGRKHDFGLHFGIELLLTH